MHLNACLSYLPDTLRHTRPLSDILLALFLVMAVPLDELDAQAIGLQHTADEFCLVRLEMVSLAQHGHRHHHLLHGEPLSDASPWPGRERRVESVVSLVVALPARLSLRVHSVRVEDVWLWVVGGVVVRHDEEGNHICTLGDLHTTYLDVPDSHALDAARAHSQSLLHHLLGVGQLAVCGGTGILTLQHSVCLFLQPFLHLGVLRSADKVHEPRQDGGRRLVPSEEHGECLGYDEVIRQPLARLRILRLDHGRNEVALVLSLIPLLSRLLPPSVDEPLDGAANLTNGPQHPHCGRQRQVVHQPAKQQLANQIPIVRREEVLPHRMHPLPVEIAPKHPVDDHAKRQVPKQIHSDGRWVAALIDSPPDAAPLGLGVVIGGVLLVAAFFDEGDGLVDLRHCGRQRHVTDLGVVEKRCQQLPLMSPFVTL
mmetsp:Transcript_6991/g.20257  ORF Transcript_6991/g.20257 Transcript_6991/m.20257 type:complete len:426 (-) Transcript_6991:108-1385(-)